MEKRVIFYNHGGCLNHGCEAIVRSTSALVKAREPQARITLCSLELSLIHI